MCPGGVSNEVFVSAEGTQWMHFPAFGEWHGWQPHEDGLFVMAEHEFERYYGEERALTLHVAADRPGHDGYVGPMTKAVAPWTPEQIENLNDYQTSGQFHPYTCARRGDGTHKMRRDEELGQLVATEDGWKCRDCSYEQDWAHLQAANGSWLAGAEQRADR